MIRLNDIIIENVKHKKVEVSTIMIQDDKNAFLVDKCVHKERHSKQIEETSPYVALWAVGLNGIVEPKIQLGGSIWELSQYIALRLQR